MEFLMEAEVFVPFIFFAFLAAVILIPIWLKERTRQSAHQLLAQALEKGQTLDPALLRQLTEGKAQAQDRPRRTLGSGVVLLALALGFLAASFLNGDMTGGGMMTAAVILGALGAAFILLALVDYSTKKKDQ
jgi:sterol desaturase/sphingolipid hydroxylase (fatty acid hydroxylase superfamily)